MIPENAIKIKLDVNFCEASFCDALSLFKVKPGKVVLFVSQQYMPEASRLKQLLNSNMDNFEITEVRFDADLVTMDKDGYHCYGFYVCSPEGECAYSPGA